MARINLSTALKNLEEQQSRPGNYINSFSLKGDGASTFVRFLIDDISDIEAYSVHRVRMVSKKGKEYAVNVGCLGAGCPLCKEAPNHANVTFPNIPLVSKAKDMVTIPLINLRDGEPVYEILFWSTWVYKRVAPMLARIRPITTPAEIERIGTTTDTSYNVYAAPDKAELAGTTEELKAKFDVKPDDIFGRSDSLIKDWDADQIAEYLETGTYPKGDSVESAPPKPDNTTAEVPQPTRRVNHGF